MLKADFVHPDCTCVIANGARRIDLKAGLRQAEGGGRAARRMTIGKAIGKRMRGCSKLPKRCGRGWCRTIEKSRFVGLGRDQGSGGS